MAIYCPYCGRSIPNDSRICAYCGKQVPSHGVMPAPEPEKKKETNVGLIIGIVLLVLIVGTIVVAATVYVYVSGIVGSGPDYVDASVMVVSENNYILVTLTHSDELYYSYDVIDIYISGQKVENMYEIGLWYEGETITIGSGDFYGYEVNGNPLTINSEYDVTIYIENTPIYSGSVTIP